MPFDPGNGSRQRLGPRDITDYDVSFCWQPPGLVRVAHQSARWVPLSDRLLDNMTSDAAGCTDD